MRWIGAIFERSKNRKGLTFGATCRSSSPSPPKNGWQWTDDCDEHWSWVRSPANDRVRKCPSRQLRKHGQRLPGLVWAGIRKHLCAQQRAVGLARKALQSHLKPVQLGNCKRAPRAKCAWHESREASASDPWLQTQGWNAESRHERRYSTSGKNGASYVTHHQVVVQPSQYHAKASHGHAVVHRGANSARPHRATHGPNQD